MSVTITTLWLSRRPHSNKTHLFVVTLIMLMNTTCLLCSWGSVNLRVYRFYLRIKGLWVCRDSFLWFSFVAFIRAQFLQSNPSFYSFYLYTSWHLKQKYLYIAKRFAVEVAALSSKIVINKIANYFSSMALGEWSVLVSQLSVRLYYRHYNKELGKGQRQDDRIEGLLHAICKGKLV